MKSIEIRPIQAQDNIEVAALIRFVLEEQNAPKTGTAYADPILDTLFEHYQRQKRANYFVLLEGNEILGCAGIAQLEGESQDICELQKMYFHPKVRGRGLGTKMMQYCLDFAREQAYTQCYIETLPWMKAAQKLYQRTGFEYIDHRMGNTGHHSCDVWMLKTL
jgi:putative acetyltransferase